MTGIRLLSQEQIAARIRVGLAARGLTQRGLGARMELSPPAVNRRVTGKHPLNVGEVAVICDFLDVSLEWLLFGLVKLSHPGDRSIEPLTENERWSQREQR